MPDLSGLRFTSTHEWVRVEDGVATIGITDHAQAQLGDVIFTELPAVGATLSSGERFGVIESVKAASDLYSPVGGRVTAVNTDVADDPARINQDPYGGGWLIALEDVDESGASLLDSGAYAGLTRG